MPTRLVSIDPGGAAGHTGIVVLGYYPDTRPFVVTSFAIDKGIDGFRKWCSDNKNFNLLMSADVVVCEHFVNRNIPGADLSAILVEGAVRFIRHDVVLQPAAGKNTLVPDAVLKELDMWFTGDHHHDRTEAARHGLLYLRNHGHIPTLRAITDAT